MYVRRAARGFLDSSDSELLHHCTKLFKLYFTVFIFINFFYELVNHFCVAFSEAQNFFDLIIIIPFYIFLELSILVPVQQRYCVDERAVPLRDCARGVDLPLEISAY